MEQPSKFSKVQVYNVWLSMAMSAVAIFMFATRVPMQPISRIVLVSLFAALWIRTAVRTLHNWTKENVNLATTTYNMTFVACMLTLAFARR